MLNWLKERQNRSHSARQLYGAIVAQARQPAFYAAWGMPDTPQGRTEVILLHTALIMRSLQDAGAAGQALARRLGETFVTDMDDSMREMSFGDLAVPREIKKVAAALYDRHMALGAADMSALAQALARQWSYLEPADAPRRIDTQAFADYARRARAGLPQGGIDMGHLAWPALPAIAGGQS